MNSNIRLAADADFAVIAAITNHYIRTTAIHFGTEDVTTDELLASWREGQSNHPWLVTTTAHGSVVGYAKAGVWRTRAAYRWIAETGIYIAPDHCGHGLGGPLYRRLLAVMRAQGFHAAIGGIALPNDASVRLHERLGFTHAGTVPQAGHKFGRWHDVGFWHLLLHPARAAQPLLPPMAAFAAVPEP